MRLPAQGRPPTSSRRPHAAGRPACRLRATRLKRRRTSQQLQASGPASDYAIGSNDNGTGSGNGHRSSSADSSNLALQAQLQTLQRHFKAQTEHMEHMGRELASLKGAHSIDLQQRRQMECMPRPATQMRPLEAQLEAISDRRQLGLYDSRYHSTQQGATPKDFRVLPAKIILVRHAESEGNINNLAYTFTPDPQVPLTERGVGQATKAGQRIRDVLEKDSEPYRLFFYTSPYKRSHQTYEAVASCFQPQQASGGSLLAGRLCRGL